MGKAPYDWKKGRTAVSAENLSKKRHQVGNNLIPLRLLFMPVKPDRAVSISFSPAAAIRQIVTQFLFFG